MPIRWKEKIVFLLMPHRSRTYYQKEISLWKIWVGGASLLTVATISIFFFLQYMYLFIQTKMYEGRQKNIEVYLERVLSDNGELLDTQKELGQYLDLVLKELNLSDSERGNSNEAIWVQEEETQASAQKVKSVLQEPENRSKLSFPLVKSFLETTNLLQTQKKKMEQVFNRMKEIKELVHFFPFIWPLEGFGQPLPLENNFLFIQTLPYTPVIATAEAEVISIEMKDRLYEVVLKHKYNMFSVYKGLHNLVPDLKVGDTLEYQQIIGYVGKQVGKSILYYGIFLGNQVQLVSLDPRKFIYLGN